MTNDCLQNDGISPCILCGGLDRVSVAEENTVFGASLPVCFCEACRVYYLGKQPDAALLEEYYTRVYYRAPESSRLVYALRSRFSRMRARSQYRYIGRLLRKSGIRTGRVLEVGCSDGTLLSEFKRRGWKVRGLEFSAFSVRKAREVHGIEPEQRDILALRPEEGRYDLIIFSHVLEHLRDPLEVLAHCRELLNPEGRIYIELPQAPLAEDCTKEEFRLSLVTTHLYDFRTESLSALAEKAGYAVSALDRFGYSFPRAFRKYSRLFGDAMMIGRVPTANPAALGAIGAGIVLLTMRYLLGRDVMRRLEPGSPWLGLGDNIRMLIRKP